LQSLRFNAPQPGEREKAIDQPGIQIRDGEKHFQFLFTEHARPLRIAHRHVEIFYALERIRNFITPIHPVETRRRSRRSYSEGSRLVFGLSVAPRDKRAIAHVGHAGPLALIDQPAKPQPDEANVTSARLLRTTI